MPALSGFDMQTLLAKAWPSIPVIVITGNDCDGARARVMRRRPLAYLLKPIDSDSLFDAIDMVLQRSSADRTHGAALMPDAARTKTI